MKIEMSDNLRHAYNNDATVRRMIEMGFCMGDVIAQLSKEKQDIIDELVKVKMSLQFPIVINPAKIDQ